MWFNSYLQAANDLLITYKGDIPFSSFLKKFFSLNKKYGSTDRRYITELSYNYFRLGRSLPDASVTERILTGYFLCIERKDDLLEFFKPEWSRYAEESVERKIEFLKRFSIEEVFPWVSELSAEMDADKFSISFLIQPDLFLHIRRGNEITVQQKLAAAGISYNVISGDCIALPNKTKIDGVITPDIEAVIQDYNSQQTITAINPQLLNINSPISVWDCCAGSGGKSILVKDHYPNVVLTVSDVRPSILHNLKKRFVRAGIRNYKLFIADLTSNFEFRNSKFDVIICDAPCTGSGTWSRTPEQLYFFEPHRISYYAELQRKIVANAAKHLRENGLFLYITCSVFKKENEDVVEFIQKNLQLHLQTQQYLKGYEKKADTLFVALFSS
ncbi:MAG: methyltransferase domain-containing protein [Chitinophagaceae bacterium]|nr:methyltransferase domain-containing protein [Chitinophagaceae bacterium]